MIEMESSQELQVIEIEAPRISDAKADLLRKRALFPCCLICSFSEKGSGKSEQSKTALKLCGLIMFYLVVMAVEIYGGLKANSLAILTDAAHILSDITGFFVSLLAVWISTWEATPDHSFGFSRVEVLGALLSIQLIWVISITLIYEAINRLTTKSSNIDGGLMCVIAAFGFAVNFFIVYWLGHSHSHPHHGHSHSHPHHGHSHPHHGHSHSHPHHDHSHHECHGEDHNHGTGEDDEEEGTKLVSHQGRMEKLNINIQGAYLHILTDMIQSVGVLIAGIVIWIKPEWLVVDLICTLIFATIAMGTTLPMLKKVVSILMEGAPNEIDSDRVADHIKLVGGVSDVHDLHVWTITLGKLALACHVRIGPGADSNEILLKVREHCEHEFGIYHVTIQIEQE